ncbi:hypothetical protein [uncultured Thiodictyon sp.]|uniref:hypothetical protein n=1 Tax=uncultured Thiodictyon sp. TaxID=1846217 RepID=UPI0025E5E8FF|nr:hypothetical protein [uncultured Thiodictyon sp.]
MSRLIAQIAAARRLVPRLSPSVLDRWPTALLVAVGLLPTLALGALALRSPAATALVLLLLPPVVRWQGRRVRLAGEVDLPTPARLKAPDPLIAMVELPGGSFRMGSDKALDP